MTPDPFSLPAHRRVPMWISVLGLVVLAGLVGCTDGEVTPRETSEASGSAQRSVPNHAQDDATDPEITELFEQTDGQRSHTWSDEEVTWDHEITTPSRIGTLTVLMDSPRWSMRILDSGDYITVYLRDPLNRRIGLRFALAGIYLSSSSPASTIPLRSYVAETGHEYHISVSEPNSSTKVTKDGWRLTVGFYGPVFWEMKDVESFIDGLQLDRSKRGAPDPKLLLGEDEREEFVAEWLGWMLIELFHPDVRAELIRRDEIHRALQE